MDMIIIHDDVDKYIEMVSELLGFVGDRIKGKR